MTFAYLVLNAVLYAVFGAWCTLAAEKTARALGYAALDRAGQSEYLVIYGGLQFGLAAAFALFASNAQYHRVGIQFALCLYAGIVIFRAATLWIYAPVPAMTWRIAALELALLIGAGVLLLTRAR